MDATGDEWCVVSHGSQRGEVRWRQPTTHHSPPNTASSYACRLHLLPRVVTGAHEGTALDVPEPELHADLVEPSELVRRDVPVERDVAVGGPEVLAEGEDVHVDGAKILHHGDDLLIGLAHPEDDPRLRRDSGREMLRGRE